jgi:hypothetical protein
MNAAYHHAIKVHQDPNPTDEDIDQYVKLFGELDVQTFVDTTYAVNATWMEADTEHRKRVYEVQKRLVSLDDYVALIRRAVDHLHPSPPLEEEPGD